MAEHGSDSDGDWDNLDDWSRSTSAMEGIIAPALRETAISPTTSWDEDDEPWPSATVERAGRGVGAPRSTSEDDDTIVDGQEGWLPTEGVISPLLADGRQIDETFAWSTNEAWEPGEPSTRGLGRPWTETMRLEELRQHEESLTLAREQGQQLPMTTDELELLPTMQEQVDGGGDGVMGQTGMAVIQPDRGDGSIGEGSDTTTSSFNAAKQYELMKDITTRFLPGFANEENRALNIMVLEAERALQDIEDATQKQDDRATVMEDHMIRVQKEILATQERVEAKKKEISTEEHLKKMATFQATKLKREVKKMENELYEMMEQLHKFQYEIHIGNDKLEKICQVQKWSKQELEQWVQAVQQKDEEYVALEKYHKYDDSQLKALRLEEATLSRELAKYKDLLETEMSESHGCQVALSKAAIEFRELHEERQDVIRQWEEAIELVHKRDAQIYKLTEKFSQNQQHLRQRKRFLNDYYLKLHNVQKTYTNYEIAIRSKNLESQKLKITLDQEMEKLKRSRESLTNIKAEHFQVQHDYAKEVAKKHFFEEEIARQKNMYQEARQNLEEMKKKVEDEYNHLDTLEKRTQSLEKLLHSEELNLKLAKKKIVGLQERHYHGSNKLSALKASEGNTMYEIKGGKSIAKALVNRIAILEVQLLKREEKVYAADFQIQLLEGKIGRASGRETSAEGDIETQKLVKELEEELAKLKLEEQTIDTQMKKSLNDMHKSTCKKEELEIRNKKLHEKNEELNLECDAGMLDNKNMTKEKEEVALEADILEMEVQRLTDLLHLKAGEVFNLDNLKQHLTKNMEDRKAEVDAQQEIQKREMKMIAEELHDLKVKRQNLIIKIDKLQCKYDCLMARRKAPDGGELTAEFFLEQLKSNREDIIKKGLVISEELKKAKIDVKFLESAKNQIIDSNKNLRTCLGGNERTTELEKEAKTLKDELQKARDIARLKQKEEKSLIEDSTEVEAKIQSKEEECEVASKTSENLEYQIENARKSQDEQLTKCKRAVSRVNSLMREFQENVSPEEAKRVTGEFVLSEMRESTRDVLHKLNQLAMEHPEYSAVITMHIQGKGFKLPSGPGSARFGSSGDSVASTPSRRAKGTPPTVQQVELQHPPAF